jgi:hypothetical protein
MNNAQEIKETSLLPDSNQFHKFSRLNDDHVFDSQSPAGNLEIVTDRIALRQFFKHNKITQPDFFFSREFNQISAWAVSRNQFPLVLKTAENQANCRNIFILRAFRELPYFFEKIAGYDAKILIESFVQAKARIEITYFNGKRAFISQIGFERSLKLSHRYRVFPVFPPGSCIDQIKDIEKRLSGIINESEKIPVRLTCSVTRSKTIPISLNFGFNRLEYFEKWGDMLNLKEKENNNLLHKIIFYHPIEAKINEINQSELKRLLSKTLVGLVTNTDCTILLSSKNPQEILEDSQKAETILKPLETEDHAAL